MKKLLATIVAVCALALVVNAADAEKKAHKRTPEQQALWKEMLSKYDENKDGKLDKTERAKISTEDKDKMEKAGLSHAKKDKKETKNK